MIGLAAICLAGSLGIALFLLLIARVAGWRRLRIGILVRPWLLAILILLTTGLAAEAGGGIKALSPTGQLLGVSWLAVSLLSHLVGRSGRFDPVRLWSARLAHGGIAIALGGVLLSSFLAATVTRSLGPGESLRLNAWTVQLHDVWPAAGEGWSGVAAELRASSGGGVILLKPELRTRFDRSIQSETANLRSGSGAIGATIGPRHADGRWPIRLTWTPMLILIPIGLVVAALGIVGAMVGPAILRRRRLRQAQLATAWWA